MRTAICEDEKIYSDKLSKSLKTYLSLHKEKAEIDVFTDGVPIAEKLKNGMYILTILHWDTTHM
ncbi:MAG: hypothetical protein ACI4KF_02395 [Huintestinicola sp.]